MKPLLDWVNPFKQLAVFRPLPFLSFTTSCRFGRLVAMMLFLLRHGALYAQSTRQWDKTLGGADLESLTALQQTRDGGFVAGGYSASGISGDKSEAQRGRVEDFWVVKLDAAGNKQWDKTIGGNGGDNLTALLQTKDGGNVLGGTSSSGISGDKAEASRGFDDYWIVKLASIRGDYEKWYPAPGAAPGSYTLTATPYTEAKGQGAAGIPLTIRFTGVRKPAVIAAARRALAPGPAPRPMLYPNPAPDGRLQLQLPDGVQGQISYRPLASVGSQLAEGTLDLTATGSLLKFDFSGQLRATGVYYLRLGGDIGHQEFRILRR